MFGNKTRAYVVIFWAVGLAILQIATGIYAYTNVSEQVFAITVACCAVGGFALIDAVRPRRGPAAGVVRRYLGFWAVVPFVCALGASAWLHYQKWNDAMADIGVVADDVEHSLCRSACEWTKLGGDDVERVVDAVVSARFPGDEAKTEEAHQFDELARVVGTDLVKARGDRSAVVAGARTDTFAGFLLAFAVQGLFILWIPLLLAMKIHKAYRALAGRALDKTLGPRSRSFTQSVDERDVRILGEDHAFFVPRFCFGALLVLGTNYVLAPYGLKASYVMSLADEHALPGHTSYALWSTSFSAAPVIVVGFVGFLVYALITATQRFMQDDLDDQALLSLLVRGLVVMLLSFALSASPIDGTISRLFVFIAGVFPVRALEAISKRANVAIDPEFETDGTKSFDGLPSLDPAKVFALRSAGIQSSFDLAAIPIESIAARVRIDPRLLGRVVDRAILLDAVGLELAKKLEPFAITSATELVAVDRDGMPDAVAKAFADGDSSVKRVAQRLAGDPRVKKVATWLDESHGKLS